MAPNLLQLWGKWSTRPFGKQIVSLAFSLYAPYFLNLRALVCDVYLCEGDIGLCTC